MDLATIISRLNRGLNGFEESTLEELDNLYYFDMATQATLELKKLLGRPVKIQDLTMSEGTRGLNLPDDFLSFHNIERPIRIDRDGQNSEGVFVQICGESEIEY